MEAEREKLEASLATADTNQAKTVYERMGVLTQKLDTATERWMVLAELSS